MEILNLNVKLTRCNTTVFVFCREMFRCSSDALQKDICNIDFIIFVTQKGHSYKNHLY